MAIAVAQLQDKDLPHLTTISVARPLNGSPFPSPSSAFLTPPEEGSHEYSSKSNRLSQSMQNIPTSNPENVVYLPILDGESTPTISTSVRGAEAAASPITPTPSTPLSNQNQHPRSSLGPTPIATRTVSASSLSTSQRESLTSSRPAPPSPAVSRRASAALSRHSSSARSTRQSKDLELSSSVISSATRRASKARSWLVKVRDFAFPHMDERHEGRGPDAPRPNRPRNRASTLSASSASATLEEGVDDEELGRGGWGSFRWNTLSNHFSWGSKAEDQGESLGVSHTDLARNFDASSPAEGVMERPYDEDGEDDPEDDEYEDGEDGGPLVPGQYRALYAFEPEGAAEMALEEGQVIKIVARGGGVGWAVAEKEDGEHALVPEGYLELIQADEEE